MLFHLSFCLFICLSVWMSMCALCKCMCLCCVYTMYLVCMLCILCMYAVFVYGVCSLCIVFILLYPFVHPSIHLSIPPFYHSSIHSSLLSCAVSLCICALCVYYVWILCMHLQLFTKSLRKNLVSCEIAHCR